MHPSETPARIASSTTATASSRAKYGLQEHPALQFLSVRVDLPELLPPGPTWSQLSQPLAMPFGRVLDKLFYSPTVR